jgi:hypothetical protein
MADEVLIGTVSTLYPLKVQLVPNDTELPVIATSSLSGIKVGSRILIQKFGKLLIGISVISNDVFTRCMLKKTDVQSIPNSTQTKITFSSGDVEYDPLGMFDDGNDTIVVPTAGWYEVVLGGRFATSTSNGRLMYLYVNGSQYTGYICGQDGSGRWGGSLTVRLELNADDYLYFNMYQNSGGSINFGGSAPYMTLFSVIKI